MRYLTIVLLAACAQVDGRGEAPQSPSLSKNAGDASVSGSARDSAVPIVDTTARWSPDTAHSSPQPYSALYRPLLPDTAELAAARADGKVSRAGSELQIKLLNGKTATFLDDTTAGLKFFLPRYAGYLKPSHSHAIHILQYEGSGVYIVLDDSTGDSTIVVGKPIPSPDGTRFVLMSMAGAGGGYDASVIEIWRVIDRKPELEFSYATEGSSWEASDPVWHDSVTIDFDKNVFLSFEKPYKKTPARLALVGATWVISDR